MWCSALLVADWGDYCCAEHAVLGSAIQCFKPALLPLVCLVWGQLSHQPAGTEVVVFKLVLPEPLSLTLSSLLFPFSLETHSCCGSLDLIVCLFFDSHNYFSFASFCNQDTLCILECHQNCGIHKCSRGSISSRTLSRRLEATRGLTRSTSGLIEILGMQ